MKSKNKAKPIQAKDGEKGAVVLLAGGNPRIAKADGDAPVQAYIAAMPGWKRDMGRRIDKLIERNVPNVRKAVKWNSPLYGIEGQGWFLGFHVLTHYVKVAFFRGTSLRPVPLGKSKSKDTRYVDIHEGELDEAQMAIWVKQASALPGWVPSHRPLQENAHFGLIVDHLKGAMLASHPSLKVAVYMRYAIATLVVVFVVAIGWLSFSTKTSHDIASNGAAAFEFDAIVHSDPPTEQSSDVASRSSSSDVAYPAHAEPPISAKTSQTPKLPRLSTRLSRFLQMDNNSVEEMLSVIDSEKLAVIEKSLGDFKKSTDEAMDAKNATALKIGMQLLQGSNLETIPITREVYGVTDREDASTVRIKDKVFELPKPCANDPEESLIHDVRYAEDGNSAVIVVARVTRHSSPEYASACDALRAITARSISDLHALILASR